MNRRTEREILKLRPNWGVAAGYFYQKPVGHILSGFTYDRGGEGDYICRYAFPLYDRHEFLSLNFGSRLPSPDGFMLRQNHSIQEEATDFVRRIERYELATYAWGSLENFLSNDEFWVALQNPWIRRAYAFTYIMFGNDEKAQEQLKPLLRDSGIDNYAHFREDLEKISTDLATGIDCARHTLITWETEAKMRFKVG